MPKNQHGQYSARRLFWNSMILHYWDVFSFHQFRMAYRKAEVVIAAGCILVFVCVASSGSAPAQLNVASISTRTISLPSKVVSIPSQKIHQPLRSANIDDLPQLEVPSTRGPQLPAWVPLGPGFLWASLHNRCKNPATDSPVHFLVSSLPYLQPSDLGKAQGRRPTFKAPGGRCLLVALQGPS